MILDKITEFLPNVAINPQLVEIPQNLKLGDPGYFKPDPIDILLGANIFWDLLCVGQVKTNNRGPILQKTHLGWILSGSIPISRPKSTTCTFVLYDDLDSRLRKFWEIEEYHEKQILTKDEQTCEDHYQSTTTKDPTASKMYRN